jgi:hypothetical protein
MFLLYLPDAEPGGQNVRDHAMYFLDMMHSEDRESKRGLMDAVIDFLHKSGLKEEAGLIWEVAAQKNVYPDSVREKSSSYWLINLHLMSEGTAVTALSRTQDACLVPQADHGHGVLPRKNRHCHWLGKAEQGHWLVPGQTVGREASASLPVPALHCSR